LTVLVTIPLEKFLDLAQRLHFIPFGRMSEKGCQAVIWIGSLTGTEKPWRGKAHVEHQDNFTDRFSSAVWWWSGSSPAASAAAAAEPTSRIFPAIG
jgi:hypothetical protein